MDAGARSRLRQWWWVAFIFGGLMINGPFLAIFNRPVFLAGVPLLFLYLVGGWLVSILAIAAYARALRRLPPEEGEG